MAKLFFVMVLSALLFFTACAPVFVPVAPVGPQHRAWANGHHHHHAPWGWRNRHGRHH